MVISVLIKKPMGKEAKYSYQIENSVFTLVSTFTDPCVMLLSLEICKKLSFLLLGRRI